MSKSLFPNSPADAAPAESNSSGPALGGRFAPSGSSEGAPELVVYYRAIARWKWAILFLAALVALGTFGILSAMDPVYSATTRILLDTSQNRTIPLKSCTTPRFPSHSLL
ncbi:MAG: hypothetical protein HC848_03555 [Limnobacter sp.]|nr:hypothetical protein [Limnobacter sp.]